MKSSPGINDTSTDGWMNSSTMDTGNMSLPTTLSGQISTTGYSEGTASLSGE